MPFESKVLVVGSTADYIEWIRQACPGEALFITDPAVRASAGLPPLLFHDEILCRLTDVSLVRQHLQNHIDREGLSLNGIACFDCESMELTAILAREYELSYPSPDAIRKCRNKHLTRTAWHTAGVPCPRARLVRSEKEVVEVLNTIGKPLVIKPVSGSGSELVFICRTESECWSAYRTIREGLDLRSFHRMYSRVAAGRPDIMAEEYVDGVEYSGDFIIENHRARVLRLCRKTPFDGGPFGTTRAYTLVNHLPDLIRETDFENLLVRGAEALGISRAVCMVDIMTCNDQIIFLEMTPRPGGDCLPFLLKNCRNMDILKLNIDFARQYPVRIDDPDDNTPYTGVRLFSMQEGVLKQVNTRGIEGDPRVREIFISKKPGHVVRTPPEDYDAWQLGHVIIAPGMDDIGAECQDIINNIVFEYESD